VVQTDTSGNLVSSFPRVVRRHLGACASVVVLLAAWAALLAPGAQAAPLPPEQDPFYNYEGSTPLSEIAPGTVLKTRTESYRVAEIALPVTAVQLLYRSTGQLGQPTVNVTSVLLPPLRLGTPPVLSYQSLYDSLTTEADPSYAISGGPVSLGSLLPNLESVLIAPALLAGEAVVIPDTEGENADFAAGTEYGYNTLDSLRAALSSPATGLAGASKIGLLGYSGGAIATEWAAELAPTYAPEINSRLIGAAFGGTLVDPAHNLRYVEGSTEWAGIIPASIIGVARSFHQEAEATPYLSEYGMVLDEDLQHTSFLEWLFVYSGLTWPQLTKPEYPTPESIPLFVADANKLIMGTHGTPTVPLLMVQGAGGELEGTPGDKPGIGRGDGVMIAGDVRTLAREYCSRGVTVQYTEYEDLSHILAAVPWLVEAYAWLGERLLGIPAPQNCSSIAPGNSLAPISDISAVVSGTLVDKRLGQSITLPAGSTFNGAAEVNGETGGGAVSGRLSIPAFAAKLKLFGGIPVTLGMSISQVGGLEGTVAPSETRSGDDTLQVPAKFNVNITSVSLLGLKIPTRCATAESVAANLGSTVTHEELLNTDWDLASSFTLPRFKCEGGFLGEPLGRWVLTPLLSGPENFYLLDVKAPGG